MLRTVVLVVALAVVAYWYQGFKAGGKVPEHLLTQNLKGKTILITGANVGIGLENAIVLAKMGARILVGCRNEERAQAAVKVIQKASGNNDVVFTSPLDLGSFSSIRNFVADLKEKGENIHTLINNAGIMACPHGVTEDGLEVQIGTNHFGHFLLTKLLLEDILKNKGRVINISSRAHERAANFDVIDNLYSPNANMTEFSLYQQSKLANVLFSFELQKRYGDQGLIAYSVHPGAVVTELGRHFNQYLVAVYKTIGPYLMKTAVEGAQTNIYAALVDPKDAAPGHYLADCTVSEHNKLVTPELQQKLWDLSEQVITTK